MNPQWFDTPLVVLLLALLARWTLWMVRPKAQIDRRALAAAAAVGVAAVVAAGVAPAGTPERETGRAVVVSALQEPALPRKVMQELERSGYTVTYLYDPSVVHSAVVAQSCGLQSTDVVARAFGGDVAPRRDPTMRTQIGVGVGLADATRGMTLLVAGPPNDRRVIALRRQLARVGVQTVLVRAPLARSTVFSLRYARRNLAGLDLVHLAQLVTRVGTIQPASIGSLLYRQPHDYPASVRVGRDADVVPLLTPPGLGTPCF